MSHFNKLSSDQNYRAIVNTFEAFCDLLEVNLEEPLSKQEKLEIYKSAVELTRIHASLHIAEIHEPSHYQDD